MRILKGLVIVCFVAIAALIGLTYIQLGVPDEGGFEINTTCPYYTGYGTIDTVLLSYWQIMNSPVVSSGLLIFMYFAGIVMVSYAGLVLGLLVILVERLPEQDFVFTLAFISCLFFAIFTTVVAVLL